MHSYPRNAVAKLRNISEYKKFSRKILLFLIKYLFLQSQSREYCSLIVYYADVVKW
jgi:hypothetical protein